MSISHDHHDRLIYADVLRVIATIAVIFIHISAAWMTSDIIGTSAWSIMNIYNIIARFSVPMFVMLSGMFLLDPQKQVSYKDIFFKYILRCLVALIVWGTFYNLTDLHGITNISIATLFDSLVHTLMAKTHYHLWFLYLIMGLYLVTPIIRFFIKRATKKRLVVFLISAFLITLIMSLLSQDYTIAARVKMIVGYIAYYVLGYYLKSYDVKNKLAIYVVGVISIIISIIMNDHFARAYDLINIPFFNDNLGVNTLFVAIAIFVFFKSLDLKENKIITLLAKISFGIYLSHDYFISILVSLGFSTLTFTPLIMIPLFVAIVFLGAFIVAYVIRKIPYIGKMIA